MKKIKEDKSIEFIIHICIEISVGNSLCSYLYLKQAEMSCFSFYLFSFSFYKSREQESRIGPAQWGWGALVEKGRGGKEKGLVGEQVQTFVHLHINAKIYLPRIEGNGDKG
jgi:hypothetical protein